MKTPRNSTLILMVLLFACVALSLLFIFFTAANRTYIMLFCLAGLVIILVGFSIYRALESSSVKIDADTAAVIVVNDKRTEVWMGPTTLRQNSHGKLKIEMVHLIQNAVDISSVYITADHVAMELKISIYYRLTRDIVIPHIDKHIDLPGEVTRVARAWLTARFNTWDLAEVPGQLAKSTATLAAYLNGPGAMPHASIILQVLFTDVKVLPASSQPSIDPKANRRKAGEVLHELRQEIDAQIVEFIRIKAATGVAGITAPDLPKLHNLLDQLDEALRPPPPAETAGDKNKADAAF